VFPAKDTTLHMDLVYRKPQLTKKMATREGRTWIKWRGFRDDS